MLAGAGEQAPVVDQEARVGAGVAVDGLVVVTDPEHVEAGERQQAEQQHVGRREVLELVDEEVPARALDRAPERAVAEQDDERGVDLVVEVDGVAPSELIAEGREHLGQPRHVVAPGLHLGGVAATPAGSSTAPRRRDRSDRCSTAAVGDPGSATRRSGAPRAPRPAPARPGGARSAPRARASSACGRGAGSPPCALRARAGPACCRRRRGRRPSRSRGRGGGAGGARSARGSCPSRPAR